MSPNSPTAANLRRLMAQQGLGIQDLARRSGMDTRTIRGILKGNKVPHTQSLNKLEKGLGVAADELFLTPSLLVQRRFDRATNPVVDEVVAEQPDLFQDWSEADFEELYSRVGTGGGLTREGVVKAARQMNVKRDVMGKVDILMESGQAEMLRAIVDVMYRDVRGE